MRTLYQLAIPTHLGFPEWREGEYARSGKHLEAAGSALRHLANFLSERVAFMDDEFYASFERALTTVELASVSLSQIHRVAPDVTDSEALRTALRTERDLTSDRVEPFLAYDAFFRCVRSAELSAGDLASEFLDVVSMTLGALPKLRLGLDDDLALVEAFAAGVEIFLTAHPTPELHTNGTASRADIASTNPASNLTAMELWIRGHHVFALLSLLFCEAARRARASLEAEDANEVVISWTRSRQLVRGTTSAMWLATSFPRARYAADVRPAMERAWPNGFSGDMNVEFARLKDELRALLDMAARGGEWQRSRPARLAVKGLCDDWHLDMISHALLAAYRVVDDASLAGKADEHAGAGPGVSAVSMLLDMAQDRREQVAPVKARTRALEGGSLAHQDRESA